MFLPNYIPEILDYNFFRLVSYKLCIICMCFLNLCLVLIFLKTSYLTKLLSHFKFLNRFKKYIDVFSFYNVKELFYVLLNVFNSENKIDLSIDYENIFDERKMPSIFFNIGLKSSIENKNKYNFLLLTVISLNNKDWKEIHPKHLELIISGLNSYDDNKLTNELILEIFENYQIL